SLRKVLKAKRIAKSDQINAKIRYQRGYKIFTTYCQTCHGSDGNGINGLGTPLNGSEWVVGDKDRLIAILMKGLNGPVKINGKVYKKPETMGHMPSFEQKLNDSQAARVINYIRHAWKNDASSISSNDVSIIKYKFLDRDKAF